MPLGGNTILWAESSPADTDSAGAGAAEIRSDKTAIRTAMGSEHNWPSGGGAATGYHLLGSARAFYDIESNVSSSGTDGRIMVTSDTSRIFHVGSAGTMYLGGQRGLSAGSAPVGGQTFIWVEEFGDVLCNLGAQTIVFPNSGFSGRPFVFLSVFTTKLAPTPPLFPYVLNNNPTQMSIDVLNTGGNSSVATLFWRSIGTRVV